MEDSEETIRTEAPKIYRKLEIEELLVPFVAYSHRNNRKKLAPKIEFEHFVYAPRDHNQCRSQALSF